MGSNPTFGTTSRLAADLVDDFAVRVEALDRDRRHRFGMCGWSAPPAGALGSASCAGHHAENQPFMTVATICGWPSGWTITVWIPAPTGPLTDQPVTFRLPPSTVCCWIGPSRLPGGTTQSSEASLR